MPSGEHVYFSANGDPTAKYELVNWQKNAFGDIIFVSVGYYDASLPTNKQFVMNSVDIAWAGNRSMVGMKQINWLKNKVIINILFVKV